MFTVKRLAHHSTARFVKNQSGIHDVLRTHGTNAGLAQLVESFTCNEKVIRSSRISSSLQTAYWGSRAEVEGVYPSC